MDAIDPAQFDRTAAAGFASVRDDAPDYIAAQTQQLEYPDDHDGWTWSETAAGQACRLRKLAVRFTLYTTMALA